MKNIIKISLFALAFFVVSCNKEVIKPNCPFNNETDESVVMKSAPVNPNGNGTKGEPGITDPNNDPDMVIKKVVVLKPN